ncbi:DMT family transporter [Pseudomonas mangiferae]|uniref:DMT family transporter n=1 Tax=Pseudomonas mangiferae TaxID=2593654 RepID=A0A553H265_9PSED|nr:DMT family transporter [Pseudomonas mangiferae]TRX75851.1 DMT family transporter [Pseudomonas mangiferae]
MNTRRALLGLHLGALAFGLSGIFGKLALAAPLAIVLGRALFAVLALIPFCRRRAGQVPLDRHRLWRLAGSGLLLGAHWLTFFHAVKISGVAIATLGFASFPAFTVLLEGLLFRERIHGREWSLVALVTLGLVLVTPHFDLASSGTGGLLWAVTSGLLFALLTLANRATVKGLNPMQAALCQNLAILVCLLPFAWRDLLPLRPLDWLWLFLLGAFCTGVAHSLFVSALHVLNARTAALVFALEPVYGIAFAWWLFDEKPGLRMLLGGALIIAAIVLSSRAKAAPTEQALAAP